VVFFTLAWAVSLRMHKPPSWPERALPQPARAAFGKLWPPCLVLFTVLSLAALEIAIAGYVPGMRDPELKLTPAGHCLSSVSAFFSSASHPAACTTPAGQTRLDRIERMFGENHQDT
jgi:hypothetical protein